MNRPIRWYDYITINIYFLGLTTLSQTMSPLVAPLLVQHFVGETYKGTFYGTARLWTLMVALLVQALMGLLSDRSTLHWGRRRPFIFIGTLASLACMAAIGFCGASGLEGMTGYWVLFAMMILLQVSSNIGQAAAQGLIPDLVPQGKRGRFSGVKAMLEIPIPMILVSFTVAKLIGAGNMWGGILVAMSVLALSMLLTMPVPEEPLKETPPALDWTPFLRLVLMTGVFTVIILGMGEAIKLAGRLMAGINSTTALLIITGAAGLAAMAIAVGLGVWISVRISTGQAARDNPSFTWWVVNRLAYMVGVINLSTFAVYFLQARLGFQKQQAAGPAAILMMIVGIFILVFALVSGWLSDRFTHKRIVMLAGLVAAFGTAIALALPNLTIIYIGGCFIGAATGMFYTANWALGTELVPKEEAGRYLGISNLAGAGAGAVGAYIGGPIADYITVRVTDVPGLGYVLLFVIYGILFLLSVVALSRVKEPARA